MDISQLKELEESLWLEETRFNNDYMQKLLAPDFFEFGRSGKIYSKKETLSHLPQKINAKLPLEKFKIHQVSKDVYLVTYISEVFTNKLRANRSSLWKFSDNTWQLMFHQGTPI
jgi:hypothetical protein